jgi:archaellum biogenesis protein FlaJ (TadC family)
VARKADGGRFLSPNVHVAPPKELYAYAVYEHELDRLSAGSSASLSLNFSIALLSSGFSLFVTLLTADFGSVLRLSVFIAICITLFINGLYLLINVAQRPQLVAGTPG